VVFRQSPERCLEGLLESASRTYRILTMVRFSDYCQSSLLADIVDTHIWQLLLWSSLGADASESWFSTSVTWHESS
jgi:hypothetical protein